ncbi:MAG: efflux RND transporter periplasmic adaptor subunit [Saprospiraceae bacterium]
MKNIVILLPLLLILATCSQPEKSGEIPAGLQEKKELLRKKQALIKTLGDEITALQEAIEAQDPDAKKKGKLVTVSPIVLSDFASYSSLQGSVAAEDLLDATAEIGGRVLQMTVKEGDAVQKGKLIAVLDVEAIQKQRAELETALDLAQTVYERQQRLWEQNIGSEIQYLQAKNNKERLEKSLATIDYQLSRNKVYAPGSGIVERVVVQAGELASPGMPIVQILNTNQLKVVVNVPEVYIKKIRTGQQVDVSIPALGMERGVSVSLIGKMVDPANRTFKVEAKLPSDPLLKPNLLAEMKIKDFEAKGVVVIPLDRIQQEVGGNRYVMLQQDAPEGKIAKKAYVEIGQSYENDIIITEGLKAGDILIMDGARGLADGQLIDIK